MHSGDKASPLVYFTLLVGKHCSHMMINRTLEHVHHNNLKAKFKTFSRFFFPGFPTDILDTFKQQN